MENQTDAQKPKGPKPARLKPGYRSPAQYAMLEEADKQAWLKLAELRFAAPKAIYSLCYAHLDFFSEAAFRSRMQSYQRKGWWEVARLDRRPESVLFLTRKGIEIHSETYDYSYPIWNNDTARRGWLRSLCFAFMKTSYAAKIISGDDYIKDLLKTQRFQDGIKDYESFDVTRRHKHTLHEFMKYFAPYLGQNGKEPYVPFDVMLSSNSRRFLLVEDPHRSIEAQLEALCLVLPFLGSTLIFRPLDELSRYSMIHKTWIRQSGRLKKAFSILNENKIQLSTAECPYIECDEDKSKKKA